MSSSGCDRRILRAFYTQYVAVLLIVLTFCVGAYQRASRPVAALRPPVDEAPQEVTLTSAVLDAAFSDEGSLKPEDARLEALATILRNHDVSATVVVEVNRESLAKATNGARILAAKLGEVEGFFLSRSVPRDAFTLRAVAGDTDGHGIAVTLKRQGEADDES